MRADLLADYASYLPPLQASWYFGANRVFLVFTISKGHVVWTASCPGRSGFLAFVTAYIRQQRACGVDRILPGRFGAPWPTADNHQPTNFSMLTSPTEEQLVESGIDWRAVTEGKQDSSAQSSDYLQARGGLREGGRHCQHGPARNWCVSRPCRSPWWV